MEDHKFRVGIIGCGGISQVHMASLANVPNVQIAQVNDIRPERAQAAAEKTGARVRDDWRQIVEDPEIDVVHLCTPHYLHAPMAVAALNAGKHVLTEKPMATSLADARDMIAAADKPGAPMLGVVFQNRYNTSVQMAKELIGSGELGKFLGARAQVSWHRTPAYYSESGWRGRMDTEGGGVLINQAIHTLDLMSYLIGPIARVRGHVSTDLLGDINDVEDNAHAVVEYASGQRGVLYATVSYVRDAPIEMELCFENRILKLIGDQLCDVTDGQQITLCDGKPVNHEGKAYWGSGHQALIDDFYRSLSQGKAFWLDGRQGYSAFNLVMAIYQSSKANDWTDLDDPEKL